jgi:hypothetical protein
MAERPDSSGGFAIDWRKSEAAALNAAAVADAIAVKAGQELLLLMFASCVTYWFT